MGSSTVPPARKSWRVVAGAWGGFGPGGRAALLVGDGDSIDALESTAKAAEAVGLKLLASATIVSTLARGKSRKGARRPEHVLLLEAP